MDDSSFVKRVLFQLTSLFLGGLLFIVTAAHGEPPPLSENSQGCVDCHIYANPGIVSAWKGEEWGG